MDLPDYFQGLFEYDYWGNREALASLTTLPGAKEGGLNILGHIIGAERVWIARFETPDQPNTQPWPSVSFDEARAAIEELHSEWKGILAELTPEKLAGDLAYRNTKGVEFRTPIRDVLLHLVMHSAYHRGQLAAAVRQAGGKPAATDYIVYVRQLKK